MGVKYGKMCKMPRIMPRGLPLRWIDLQEMLSPFSTRLLKIYCTKPSTWQFLLSVKSPQSSGKIPILYCQCESKQKAGLEFVSKPEN